MSRMGCLRLGEGASLLRSHGVGRDSNPDPLASSPVWFFSLRPAAPGARVPAGPGQRAPLRSALVCLTSGGAPGTPGQSGAGAWGGNYRRLSQHPTLVPGVSGSPHPEGSGLEWRRGVWGWGLLSAELLLPGRPARPSPCGQPALIQPSSVPGAGPGAGPTR